ncbi:MAG: site-2 protease family protein [Polyangiaceae bacterium]|nr:site-2 protease family protein [Polyangiaceae bacterium]
MFALTFSNSILRDLVLFLVPMVLSLSVHEYAHAWVAWRLGDDTAAREGRLTLSPLAHLDPFGSLLVPAFNVLVGGFAFIGWAKPVPVRPERFGRKVTMRTGMILTAIAGPLSNLALAILAIATYAVLLRFAPQTLFNASGATGIAGLLDAAFKLNIGLFVFNLLPLPPLDGSRLLPRSMDGFVAAVSPYSFILLLVIINIGILRDLLIARPVLLTTSLLQLLFGIQ